MLDAKFEAAQKCKRGFRKNLIIQVHGLEFPKPGKYYVTLKSGSETVGWRRRIDVVAQDGVKGKENEK